MMNNKIFGLVALALASACALTSCETATGTGALIGAGTGAVIGNSVGGGRGYYRHGDNTGNTIAGAAIGAGVGALVGAAIDADERGYYEGHPGSYYPYGRRIGRPGLVESPYPPHALIDVRGVPRGALVRDPASGRVFRKP